MVTSKKSVSTAVTCFPKQVDNFLTSLTVFLKRLTTAKFLECKDRGKTAYCLMGVMVNRLTINGVAYCC